ncbi:MAG: hypothetical protein IIC11_01605 [Proteobacteria bacterium]|nr:hypothetical protein [Pseudomonadota bacterium]
MQKIEVKTRQAITELAARFIAENGLITYHAAKRKAADHFGYNKRKDLPTNSEIERSVVTYQNLFLNACQPQALFNLRCKAVDIMNLFERFNPRLAGSVLAGTAGNHSEIIVHLFSDKPETISIQLLDNNIPHELVEKRMRTAVQKITAFPAYCFFADDIPVVLVIFPEKDVKHAPVCPINGKLMKRANITKVKALLQETG